MFVVLASVVLVVSSGCSSAVPQSKPTPTATSAAQYAQLYAKWGAAYLECANAHGEHATMNDQGAINSTPVPGRNDSGGLDSKCLQKLGNPPVAQPLTKSFLRGLYTLLLSEATCLRASGYKVSNPPSMKEWVKHYDGYSWNPLTDVGTAGKDIQSADLKCPQPDPVEAEKIGHEIDSGRSVLSN